MKFCQLRMRNTEIPIVSSSSSNNNNNVAGKLRRLSGCFGPSWRALLNAKKKKRSDEVIKEHPGSQESGRAGGGGVSASCEGKALRFLPALL